MTQLTTQTHHTIFIHHRQVTGTHLWGKIPNKIHNMALSSCVTGNCQILKPVLMNHQSLENIPLTIINLLDLILACEFPQSVPLLTNFLHVARLFINICLIQTNSPLPHANFNSFIPQSPMHSVTPNSLCHYPRLVFHTTRIPYYFILYPNKQLLKLYNINMKYF